MVIDVASQLSKDLQSRKVDPTVGTIVHANITSLRAPKLLQRNLLAAVSSPYLTRLIGIFAIASFLHSGEILCSVCVTWYVLCLPSGFLLLTIYSICNLTDTSWDTFIIIFSYHYFRWTLSKLIVLSCTLLLSICILQGCTEFSSISKSKVQKIRELQSAKIRHFPQYAQAQLSMQMIFFQRHALK